MQQQVSVPSSTTTPPANVSDGGIYDGDVFVVVRFDSTLANAYSNSIKSQASVMSRNFDGREVVFCPEMHTVAGPKRQFGIGVLEFPSQEKAHEWLMSAQKIRQHDWLYGVEILMIPARGACHRNLRVVELIDWYNFSDPQTFLTNYLYRMPEPDPSQDICPFNVAAAPDYAMQRLRGSWCPRYIVINQWHSIEEAMQESSVVPSNHPISGFRDCASATVHIGVNTLLS